MTLNLADNNWCACVLCAVFLVAAAMVASGCRDSSSAGGDAGNKPGINLFTEIFQFPDRKASAHGEPVEDNTSDEPMRFAGMYGRVYEERVAKMGGRPPLEGPEKLKFEKEMMLVQSGIIFDMRLGSGHPARKKFLEIAAWTFDRRQPILEKRRPYIMAKEKEFKKAEELDFQLHEKLLVQVREKLKAVFSPKDYGIITGGM